MAHQLDHPGGDAGVLQPGREGVANVEVDRCQVAAFSS
jgi:hypothetical protein